MISTISSPLLPPRRNHSQISVSGSSTALKRSGAFSLYLSLPYSTRGVEAPHKKGSPGTFYSSSFLQLGKKGKPTIERENPGLQVVACRHFLVISFSLCHVEDGRNPKRGPPVSFSLCHVAEGEAHQKRDW